VKLGDRGVVAVEQLAADHGLIGLVGEHEPQCDRPIQRCKTIMNMN
jgi:hypothetical protein